MPYMHYKTNCFNKQKVWNVWFQVGERSQRGPWQDGCYFLCHCVVVAIIAIFILIITRCGTQGRSTRVGGRTTCNRARGNTGETHSENQWGTQGNIYSKNKGKKHSGNTVRAQGKHRELQWETTLWKLIILPFSSFESGHYDVAGWDQVGIQ